MQANPFSPTLKSEDGKTEIPNQRFQDWQDGYLTGLLQGGRLVFYEIPKALGIKLPLVGDFFGKLK